MNRTPHVTRLVSIGRVFVGTSLAVVLTSAFAADDAALVARYLKYRSMPRVTQEQLAMAEAAKTLCIAPGSVRGPHEQPGVHLYASADAIAAKKKAPFGPYPVGAVIVKEKFETKGGTEPSLITVMEKVGATGKVEDWKFSMIRLSDRTITRDGFAMSCAQCHGWYKLSDYVTPTTDTLVQSFAQKSKSAP